jgi:hypothetical protein
LLAGEKLLADLHAMEVAYLENDRNELEITRPVSLKEIVVGTEFDTSGNKIDLTALAELRDVSNWNADNNRERLYYSVSFHLSEEMFFYDFSQPHCFGRIRRVNLKILCSSDSRLSAELNMDKNTLRINNDKTIENRIGIQTLATSTANSEYGKCNFNFNRDKFNPFEGAGIDSHWNLTISAPLDFNPDSITDVIIEINYTARNG